TMLQVDRHTSPHPLGAHRYRFGQRHPYGDGRLAFQGRNRLEKNTGGALVGGYGYVRVPEGRHIWSDQRTCVAADRDESFFPLYRSGQAEIWHCGAGKLQQTEVRKFQAAEMSTRKGSGDCGSTEAFPDDLILKTRMICQPAIIRVLFVTNYYHSIS